MRTLAELGAHFSRGVEKFQRDPWEWFLLVGDRLVLAAVLATAFLTVVVTLFAFDVVNATSEEPMLYLFSMLAGGNITLLTIVLSINQLVLTRQLKTPGEVSAHIENAIEYRMEVETQSERETVPVMPTEFLGVLLANARANARKLDSAAQSDANGTVTAELTSLADSVVVHTNYIEGVLDRSQGGYSTRSRSHWRRTTRSN